MPEVTIASAYHNYLVEGRLRRDLVVGDPDDPSGFFLVAHPVHPGGPMPLISGQFFGRGGEFLLRMDKNALVENPEGFSLLETRNGWVLMDTSLEALLSAEVRSFESSHLSVLRGLLHDPLGRTVVWGDDWGLHLPG